MNIGNLEGQSLSARYQIQSLLGQGGMAAVYKAYDPNLHRTVAVKVIHPHLSRDPEFTRRFEEEATGIAHLRHPNIIQVFDFNHDNDLYYMVMEFIAGETLQDRLKRLNQANRRLGVKEVVKFAADICDAAEYAHERGVIHRDIKPANVMLDVHGKAILMDFGIARMVGGGQHTATGAVLGTAMYMSPEQIQGLHADARADIYSIGVTLFEMLSGKPPFEADSAMTLMMMHLNDPVPDIRELQPEAPPALLALVAKSLAKQRDERFQTAAEMANALRCVLDAPGKPYIAAAAASQAVAADATVIEGPLMATAGGTMIEPMLGGAAMARAGAQPAPPTRGTGPQAAVGRATGPQPYAGSAGSAGGTQIEQPLRAAPVAAASQAAAFPTSPDQSAFPVQAKRGKAWLWILLIVIVLGAAGGFFAYRQFGSGAGLPLIGGKSEQPSAVSDQPSAVSDQPSAISDQPSAISNQPSAVSDQPSAASPQPAAVSTPIPTSENQQPAVIIPQPTSENTPTSEPTPTAEPIAAPLIIGGADKIAFLNGNNVWAANLDGSELSQLTSDGVTKTNLRWLPGGQALSYISGKCIHSVSLLGEVADITCFNNSKYLEAFEVSPDGSQVVISLDNQLFLAPFDLEALANIHTQDSLSALAECVDLAPYKRNFANSVDWSADGKRWAALVMGVLKDGRRGDLVQVFAVDRCIPNPLVQIQFPEPHFAYKSYTNNPVIPSIDWDSEALFAFNDVKRNGGFGDLHIFNMQEYEPLLSVNPVNSRCCYRDASWSPDGSQLVFAYQDIGQGSSSTTQLYLIPYGSIGTGAKYEPLPLPVIENPKESPQPVLRPAAP